MTRRKELEQRLRKLGEIGEIMRSMKNLALMETRKLAHFLDVQDESVRMVEAAAVDFLSFYPQYAFQPTPGKQALLVIGSERGFCGDFNDELLQEILQPSQRIAKNGGRVGQGGEADRLEAQAYDDSPLLAVGGKLSARLEKHPSLYAQFDGPTVAEDVPRTLNRLVPEIGRLQQNLDCPGLAVLHHRSGAGVPVLKSLLPPFAFAHTSKPESFNPPILNLAPDAFFAELVHHYLFAALHEVFHTSLMAENQRRIQHLEGAIQRLEEKTEILARKSHTLRQEEITEEIEVILLSVGVQGQ